MDFDSLSSSVHQAWEFLWPPMVQIVLLLGLWRWISPVTFASAKASLSTPETVERARKARAVIRLLGMAQIQWLIVLVLIVFVLYLTSRTTGFVGANVPPGVSFRMDALSTRCLSQADLMLLHDKFRNEPDWIDSSMEFINNSDHELGHWSETAGRYYDRFNTIKALMLAAICFYVLELLKARVHWLPMRLLAALVPLFVALAAMFGLYLYATQQAQFERIREVRLSLTKEHESKPPEQSVDPAIAAIVLYPERYKQLDKTPWWDFTVVFGSEVRWIWQQLSEPRRFTYQPRDSGSMDP